MWVVGVAGVLLMAWVRHRRAAAVGQWSWVLFGGIMGAVAAFLGLFLWPITHWKWLWEHPALLGVAMVGGILGFVAALIAVVSRIAVRMQADKR